MRAVSLLMASLTSFCFQRASLSERRASRILQIPGLLWKGVDIIVHIAAKDGREVRRHRVYQRRFPLGLVSLGLLHRASGFISISAHIVICEMG